ncbi:MAG: hypothetical protein ABIJ16_07885 [Bacteroidota bacterium]
MILSGKETEKHPDGDIFICTQSDIYRIYFHPGKGGLTESIKGKYQLINYNKTGALSKDIE